MAFSWAKAHPPTEFLGTPNPLSPLAGFFFLGLVTGGSPPWLKGGELGRVSLSQMVSLHPNPREWADPEKPSASGGVNPFPSPNHPTSIGNLQKIPHEHAPSHFSVWLWHSLGWGQTLPVTHSLGGEAGIYGTPSVLWWWGVLTPLGG